MPRSAGQGSHRRGQARLPQDWSFARERDFWLLSMANLFAGMATGGAISQLAPMISENGLSPAIAALGLSTFAAGQFIGKVGGGWLLDRFEPRRMAILMTIIPSIGFLMFLQADPGMALLVLLACGMIGALSGADVDIYAYFVARRFGLGRYGSVFGALHGLGWIGIAAGITLFSRSHTMTGSYATAQTIAIGLLLVAATLLFPVRLPKQALSTGGQPGGNLGGDLAGPIIGDAKSG